MTRTRRWAGALLLLVAAATTAARAQAPEPAPRAGVGVGAGTGAVLAGLPEWSTAVDAASLMAVAERWHQRGQDHPDEVLAAIRTALSQPSPATLPLGLWQRLLWRTQGLVAGRAGREAATAAAVAALQARSGPTQDPLAQADAWLVQAVAADHSGKAAQADAQARMADERYQALCQGPSALPGCEHRMRWRAVHLQALRAESQGQRVVALALAQRGQELAAAAGDPLTQAQSTALMAVLQQSLGETAEANRLLASAERLARRHDDGEALLRVRMAEARLLNQRGEDQAAHRALELALHQAQRLGMERLTASINVNLSDTWLRQGGQARRALSAIEQALPVMQRVKDLRNQPVLLHNRGLARLQLGQLQRGRADLEAALDMWRKLAAWGELEGAMREYAEALAGAGDWRGALEIHHRERELHEDLLRGDQEAQLADLRTRYGRETEQLALESLTRDNALKAARLANHTLQQRVWAVAAGLLVLALLVLAWLVKRTRDTNRALHQSQARLKVQSERDALTGLANRRHLRAWLDSHVDAASGLRGGLLLLDLDHFKRINDDNGHAVGDAVLQAVAQRLQEAVRAEDIVCRWGGEEFLIWSPEVPAEVLDALAQRLLRAVGDQPVALPDGRELPVTVSIGHAAFPLPGQSRALPWEAAVNLVDMALYTAKGHARDCAVGLQALSGVDATHLAQDFEAARARGLVQLQVFSRPARPAPG